MNFFSFLKENKSFLFPYFGIFVLCCFFLVTYDKTTIHLAINALHSPLLDEFFKHITYLGDGVVAIITSLILLFFRYRSALFIGLGNIIGSIITQSLKHFVFDDHLRPTSFLKNIPLHLVEGVETHSFNSFPSGHTTTAFCLYLGLAILSPNKALKFFFFILASIVAYSRMYLSQHFLEDLCLGSVIGCLATIISAQILQINKPHNLSGLDRKIGVRNSE